MPSEAGLFTSSQSLSLSPHKPQPRQPIPDPRLKTSKATDTEAEFTIDTRKPSPSKKISALNC